MIRLNLRSTAIFCRSSLASRSALVAFAAFASAVFLLPALPSSAESQEDSRPASQWVHPNERGQLVYERLPGGDRIMDFSTAGYMGGGVAIPDVPVKQTLKPSGDDDSAAIQAALDEVAKLPLVDGFRGAVLLAPGEFHCRRTLTLGTSGVVLRGSGSGAGGTTLAMTGDPHLCLAIRGSATVREIGKRVRITDAYVPSGADTFNVADASGFKPGDPVLIFHPVTKAWVAFMGMDKLVRNGRPETWVSGELRTKRVIKSVAGNRVTLDVPLTDCLDAKFLEPAGASVVKCETPGRVSQIGVEHLRIVAPPQVVEISQQHHQALRASGASDIWVRDLAIADTVNSVGISARRATVQDVRITHRVATQGAAKPADFSADASQVLFHRCSATGSNVFYFVTGARVSGPIVVLDCEFHGPGWIQPHQRWATGLLLDNCRVPDGGLELMNRGEMGSGHGWTIGWSVAWNCVAKELTIQQPPGSANWAIGCRGARKSAGMPFGHQPPLPEGIFESPDAPVAPASLYRAQLRERLGEAAVANLLR